MSKKKKEVISIATLGQKLYESYSRWVHIFLNGCSDPSWSDGVNINLVRNHIFAYKEDVEKTLGTNYIAYPDEYFYLEPVELPSAFMAKARIAPCMSNNTIEENRGGFHSLSQCFVLNWKEALS